MARKSNPSLQLKTTHCLANALARSFVVSVLPVPAGPSGAPPPYKATPFVMRAPSSASDDPMAGGGMSVDDRLVAGMEQPADTDAHDSWVHVTHEGAAPSTGTASTSAR